MKTNESKLYYVCECFTNDKRKSMRITDEEPKGEYMKDILFFGEKKEYKVVTDFEGFTRILHRTDGLVYILRLVHDKDIETLFNK